VTQVIHTPHDGRFVVYLSTRNLYDVLPAAYNSLLAHTSVDHVYILIEDDKLPFRLPDNVSCVNVSGQTFFPPDGANTSTAFTYMALMKAALTKIFPDLSRILVLDVDTIVNDDISALWNESISPAYYAAVTEPHMSKQRGYPYANFGVVMLNLDLLRSTGMDNKLIREINTHYHAYPEQEAFHMLCGERFVSLPSDYNDTTTGFRVTAAPHHSRISHFAGLKSWVSFKNVRHWVTLNAQHPFAVCYIGNRRYYKHMLTAAKSLLFHSPVDKIYFLTEDDTFPYDLPPCVQIINVSDQHIFRQDGPNINGYYSYMTLMRAALTKVLPDNLDRVLLLDPDTIVTDDISPVWNYDITDYYFAAVRETRNNDHLPPYWNAGVMLMNLRKLRADGMDDRIIREINTHYHKHLEQDVLNFFCHDLILDLPSTYNACFVTDPCKYPRIMHYLSTAKKDLPKAQQQYQDLTIDQLNFGKEE